MKNFCVPLLIISLAVPFAAFSKASEKYVDDKMPSRAVIYVPKLVKGGKKQIVPGTEASHSIQMEWVKYDKKVPCSDIKRILWHDSYTAKLQVRGNQYGGKYMPRPTGGAIWRSPSIISTPLSKQAGKKVAKHCGVDFREIE